MPLLPGRAGRASAPFLRALQHELPRRALFPALAASAPQGFLLYGVGRGLAAVPGPAQVSSAAVVRAAGSCQVSPLLSGSPGLGNLSVHTLERSAADRAGTAAARLGS